MSQLLEDAYKENQTKKQEAFVSYKKLLKTFMAYLLAAQDLVKETGTVLEFKSPLNGRWFGRVIQLKAEGLRRSGSGSDSDYEPIRVTDLSHTFYRPAASKIYRSFQEIEKTDIGQRITKEMVEGKLLEIPKF